MKPTKAYTKQEARQHMESTQANIHGLSRTIPSHIKKEVRRSCGYGCIICGNAICQYEHIDPEFHNAKIHDPQKIALLCGACHDKVTRKIWSKEKVLIAKRQPYCLNSGRSRFQFDISAGGSFFIKVGNTTFKNLPSIIKIDDIDILSISPPETSDAPPLINASFFDRNNTLVAQIEKNEWLGSHDAFDIETSGQTIIIRSAPRKIDLRVHCNPPNLIEIIKLHLSFGDTAIRGDSASGFTITTHNSSVSIPNDPKEISKAPFWISVRDNVISIGDDKVIEFIDESGLREMLPGHYTFNARDVAFREPEEFGEDAPPGYVPGSKIMRVRDGSVIINFSLPKPHLALKQKSRTIKQTTKTGPNDTCPCGSGKKYKKCCRP